MGYQFDNVSVLIVEDNQPMMEIMKALLITYGVRNVYTAKNGQVGLKIMKQYNPDLVIADWMMKPIDGISFTRIVREGNMIPNPYVPIILVTGFTEKKRVIQARDAGVTEFLSKPFNAQDLYKRIVQIIERPREFVKSDSFLGPDRRRSRVNNYFGPFRRSEDTSEEKIAYEMQEQRAQEVLEDIRTQSNLKKADKFIIPDDVVLVDRRS